MSHLEGITALWNRLCNIGFTFLVFDVLCVQVWVVSLLEPGGTFLAPDVQPGTALSPVAWLSFCWTASPHLLGVDRCVLASPPDDSYSTSPRKSAVYRISLPPWKAEAYWMGYFALVYGTLGFFARISDSVFVALVAPWWDSPWFRTLGLDCLASRI